MRAATILLAALLLPLGLASCRGCRDNAAAGGDGGRWALDTGARPAPEQDDEEPADDGGASSSAAAVDGSAPVQPARPPQVVAQRFVVGWASRNFDALGPICAERAAELVRSARAGEIVDTPLGRLALDGPRPTSFSFSEMSLSPIRDGVARVAFTSTMRFPEGEPVTTEHVLLVRLSDGVVLDWLSPTAPAGSGV